MIGLSILHTEINKRLWYFSAVLFFYCCIFLLLYFSVVVSAVTVFCCCNVPLLLFYCCCFTAAVLLLLVFLPVFYLPLVSHVQAICEKNAKNRSKLTINHTGGSMKLKRRKYEMVTMNLLD